MKFDTYINESISIVDELPNNNLLTEAGLSRIIQKVKIEKKDFAIITAYRNTYDKQKNIKRNRELRGIFNSKKMGVYPLVDHWRECQLDNVKYEDCPENELEDVIERLYLVIRPESMDWDEFKDMIKSLAKKFEQDGAIISKDGVVNIIEGNGNMFEIGSEMKLNKIAQAYSQYVKKMNVPFVFEAEVPSTNIGRMIFEKNGLLYPKENV